MTDTQLSIQVYEPGNKPADVEPVVSFLFQHLEQFGDPADDIRKAIDYSLSEEPGKGGFVLVAELEGQIVGATVVNETGMKDYIPENILVYIAVDASKRGHGIGKRLMETALKQAEGSVALHVEPDNPAKKLYEKLGFTNKYLEMRYQKPS